MTDERDQLFENIQTSTKTILLVEDDTTIAELLVQMISQETHYQVFAVPDGPQALDLVKNIKPELLILDYWLPTTHGIELYDRLHTFEHLRSVPTLLMSSMKPPLRELHKRAITFLAKPFDLMELLHTITTLLT